MFSDIFYNGDRHAAMEQLRVTTRNPSVSLGARFGLFAGLCFFPMLFIIYAAASFSWSSEDMAWDKPGSFPVYRSVGLIAVFLFLFAINIEVWTRKRINYVFIFEFDPRAVRSPFALLEVTSPFSVYGLCSHSAAKVASIFLLIWSLSLCGYLLGARYGYLVFGVPFYVYPLTLLLALILFLVNPINIAYRHARYWLLRMT